MEYAASLSSTAGTLPTLPYFIGRTECEPVRSLLIGDSITNEGTTFPRGELGWDPLFEFFHTFFDFNLIESTVIIGAHTVGRAHSHGSGFDGKWTSDRFSFNNGFFINLLDKKSQWDQTAPKSNGFPQWSNMGRQQNEDELMMLNADIS